VSVVQRQPIQNRRLRLALALFLPTALLISVTAWSLKNAEERLTLAREKTSQKLTIELASNGLKLNLEAIARELRYLSRQQSFLELVQPGISDKQNTFLLDAITFTKTAPIFSQIRWIDENGNVRIRVMNGKDTAETPSDYRPEDEGDRHLLKLTNNLSPDSIYVSPLVLSRKDGRVSVPLHPVIHFATPVEDLSGNKRGILVIDYHAKELLDSLDAIPGSLSEEIMLLNAEGYWLKSPEPSDAWGFMFGRPITFGKRYPTLWKELQMTSAGQRLNPAGLWTWQTVRPLSNGHQRSSDVSIVSGSAKGKIEREDYVWKLISRVDPKILARSAGRTQAWYLTRIIVPIMMMAVVSWLVASILVKKARERERLERMASTDGLTRLANHRAFMEELNQSFACFNRDPQISVGLLLLDLDHFKSINDTYGHAFGDKVLERFSKVLRQNLRESDSAGRLGGEEFCVLLRGTDLQGVLQFANRLRQALTEQPLHFEGRELMPTVSGGCARFLPQDTTAGEAMRRADMALYRAKITGRDRILLDESKQS
jgi:diguanylate cyclase (GGDEF)-like protein